MSEIKKYSEPDEDLAQHASPYISTNNKRVVEDKFHKNDSLSRTYPASPDYPKPHFNNNHFTSAMIANQIKRMLMNE